MCCAMVGTFALRSFGAQNCTAETTAPAEGAVDGPRNARVRDGRAGPACTDHRAWRMP